MLERARQSVFIGSTTSWGEAYGIPEKIWLGVWGLVSVIWLANASAIPDFGTTMLGNVTLLVVLLVLPQLTVRMGALAHDLMRALFSFLSAYLGYERVGALIGALRTRSYELEMLRIDEAIFGGHASVWLERVHHPALSEYLQAVYLFYFPQLLLVGVVILVLRRRDLFYEYIIAVNLALILTHVSYYVVPLRSPFLVADLYPQMLSYTRPLEGLWYFDELRQSLLEATTMRYDCFPSGHTMHSVMAMVFAWRASKWLGVIETAIAVSIVFSTLYLRYHYAIDLVAGVAGAIGMMAIGHIIARRTFASDPAPPRRSERAEQA